MSATTAPVACVPAGPLRPFPSSQGSECRCGRAWQCACGAQLTRVPQGTSDWTWQDTEGRQTVPTEFGRALAADPLFWQHLAEQNIAAYSDLSARYSLLMLPTYHAHRAAPCRTAHEPLPVLECCGMPMHAQPLGWACRRSGQRFDYADARTTMSKTTARRKMPA